MLTDRLARVLAVVVVMFTPGIARAQEEALDVPALRSDLLDLRFDEMTSGPARTDRVPDFARYVATFRTPVIPERTHAFQDPLNHAASAAARSLSKHPDLSYEQRRKLPTSGLDYTGLIWRTIVTDAKEGHAVVEWTMYGVDRAMVELLVRLTIEAYATAHTDEVRRILEAWRRSQESKADTELELKDLIPQITAIESELETLGLTNRTLESIAEALADAERQQRLTRVELAGIEGRLRAVSEGLNGNVADSATDDARELRRLRVGLQVDQAGTSNKMAYIANWIETLRSGRANTTKLHQRSSRRATLEWSARATASTLGDLTQQAADLARAAEFHVLDNRVIVSPLAGNE